MSRPVPETPPLPYPSGSTNDQLAGFNQDLIKALYTYLSDIARRTNESLPKDGTEAMQANLDMGGFSILNVANITISGSFTAATGNFTTLNVSGTSNLHATNVTGTLAITGNETVSGTLGVTGLLSGVNETLSGTLGVTGIATMTEVDTPAIKFPATQVPSAGANVLDDYEEGTWTPVVTASTGTIGSYTANAGIYTKIGRLVFAYFDITITAVGSASGYVQVSLPFTSVLSAYGVGREITSGGNTFVIAANGAGTSLIYYNNNATMGALRFIGDITYSI